MEWLNYHHLLYFWTVAKEGSIAKASKTLRLAPATISGQIRMLEEALDQELFSRTGRSLVLTDTGQVVYRYAEDIFSLGRELRETLKGRPAGRPVKLRVGVADVIPKLIAHRLLQPALAMPEPVHLVVREARADQLLAELSLHELDVVITDTPVTGAARVRAFNHPLGETGITFFATPNLAKRYRTGFPKSLERAPLLLPTETSTLRRALDHFFDATGVRPQIVAEFDDSALLKVFGEHGAGLFAGPTMIEKEIGEQYGVVPIGRTDVIRERFYAVTVERKIKHPAAVAIAEAARLRNQDKRPSEA